MSLLARHRQLAPSASLRVSPLCLGAMTFGTSHRERYGEMTKETAFIMLDRFYENGGNFIDTANIYHEGESELWLGEWMRSRANRDEIVLATKYTNAYKAGANIKSNVGGNGTKSMRLSIEASLKRLGTSYIDIYYVHIWDFTTSIPELMHGLNDLVRAGKVNYLGISDTPAWVVSKANQYARDHGLRQFVVYQGMWNAAMRDFERDIIPMCQDEGMAICPYGTLNQGRFQTQEKFKEREKHNPGRNVIPLSQRDKDVSKVLEEISNNRDHVQLHHVALSYVLSKSPYVFPIIGGRTVDHIQTSFTALKLDLTDEEIDRIENAYDFDHGFPQSFLSGTLFSGSKSKACYGPGANIHNNQFGIIDWVEAPKSIRVADR